MGFRVEETLYEWRDDTSYTQSDKERIPRSWVIHFPGFRLVVWKSRHEELGYQYSMYGKLSVQDRGLDAKEGPEARREALSIVKRTISELYDGVFRKGPTIKDPDA